MIGIETTTTIQYHFLHILMHSSLHARHSHHGIVRLLIHSQSSTEGMYSSNQVDTHCSVHSLYHNRPLRPLGHQIVIHKQSTVGADVLRFNRFLIEVILEIEW